MRDCSIRWCGKNSRTSNYKTNGITFTWANGEVEVKLKKDLNFSTFIAIKPTAVKRKRKHAFERERISELDLQMDNLKTILRCSNATPIRSFKSSKFVCCYCHDEFPDPIYLKRHNIKSHVFDQERPDVLNIRSLSRYIVYLDITDLKCKICDEEIDNLKLLTKHITKEHNEFINQGLNNHILCFKFDIADVYKCVECNYIINDFTKLQLHMNKHYKNYLCEFCDEGFINRNMMVDHKQEVHNMQQKVKYRVKFVAKKQKKIH